VFYSAHVYLPGGPLEPAPSGSPVGAVPASEGHHLAALATEGAPGGWRSPGAPADYFAAKALLEAVLAVAGVEWTAEPGGPAFLHPGRSARVVSGEHELGWLGELHPQVAAAWDLGGPVGGFEIDVEAVVALAGGAEPVFRDVTSFVLQKEAVPPSAPAPEPIPLTW
jgi:phenylalanyl-tRNA synthetase beta chain